MRYLTRTYLNDLEGYYIYRCNKVINEHTLSNIWYYKGQYKGYSFVLKLVHYTKRRNPYVDVPFYQLYNSIKQAKSDLLIMYHKEVEYKKGIKYSLYDCSNYLNNLEDSAT